MSEEIKDVSEISDAMKKQMEAQTMPGLPMALQMDIQKIMADALQGKFGQLKIAIGTIGKDETISVRMLIFPDAIMSDPIKAPVESNIKPEPETPMVSDVEAAKA